MCVSHHLRARMMFPSRCVCAKSNLQAAQNQRDKLVVQHPWPNSRNQLSITCSRNKVSFCKAWELFLQFRASETLSEVLVRRFHPQRVAHLRRSAGRCAAACPPEAQKSSLFGEVLLARRNEIHKRKKMQSTHCMPKAGDKF